MPTTPQDARRTLARKLRVLRAARGWSQEVLAAVAGLHRNYVSGVERGRRNVGVDNLARLARALDVPVHELLRNDLGAVRIEERAATYGAARAWH